jgi:hypothetical protein
MHKKAVSLVLFVFVLSCGRPPGGVRTSAPAKDWSSQQRTLWSMIPADADGALVIADVGHLLERLRALRAVASAGPITRKTIDGGLASLQAKLGFDPLDAQGWREHGIEVAAPAGLVAGEGYGVAVVLGLGDAARAKAFLGKLFDDGEAPSCDPHGRWMFCAGKPVKVAASEAESLWPRLAKDLSPEDRKLELLAYAPLDQGRVAEQLRSGGSEGNAARFFAQSKAAFLGASLDEDRVRFRGVYWNPDSAKLAHYFAVEPGTRTMLGVAAGARAATRATVSGRALWQLMLDELPARTIDQVSGGFMLSTGLDLKRDIVDNLTGELVGVSFEGGTSWLNGAFLVGTQDDARTRRICERIDSLASGGLAAAQAMIDSTGWKIRHQTETVAGRPDFVFATDVPPDQAPKIGGLERIELHLTSAPGALVIGFDKKSVETVEARIARPAQEFLAQLETPEARRAFESRAPLVQWSLSQSPVSPSARKRLEATFSDLKGLSPDAPQLMGELAGLLDLLYDATFVIDVAPSEISMMYQLTLM